MMQPHNDLAVLGQRLDDFLKLTDQLTESKMSVCFLSWTLLYTVRMWRNNPDNKLFDAFEIHCLTGDEGRFHCPYLIYYGIYRFDVTKYLLLFLPFMFIYQKD